MKAAAIAVAIAIAAAAAIVLGGNLWIQNYIRGAEFRGLVEDAAGAALRAEAGFDTIRWNGSSAYAGTARFRGGPGSVLKSLDASGVRADVNWRAALSGAWRVESLTAASLDAEFQKPDPSAGAPSRRPARGGRLFLPARFEIATIGAPSSRLVFEGWTVTETALTATPDGGAWKFDGRGGRLAGPGFPGVEVDSFSLRANRGDLFLTSASLRLGTGRIAATGDTLDGGSLELDWQDLPAAKILPAKWAVFLEGTTAGQLQLGGAGSLNGTATLTHGRAIGLPALVTLADFTKNPTFRNLPVQEIRAEFSRLGGGWDIRAISAESKGLLKVEGRLRIGDDGSLDGTLHVGLTSQTLQWLPGSQDRVFTTARDGYLWTPVRLGGSLEKPAEDLTPRLASAMGSAVIETGASLLKDTPAKAVEGAVEGAKSLIDAFFR